MNPPEADWYLVARADGRDPGLRHLGLRADRPRVVTGTATVPATPRSVTGSASGPQVPTRCAWCAGAPRSGGPGNASGLCGGINHFTAHPDKRDDMVASMTSDAGDRENCHNGGCDPDDPDAMWLTEGWESRKPSQASVDQTASMASLDIRGCSLEGNVGHDGRARGDGDAARLSGSTVCLLLRGGPAERCRRPVMRRIQSDRELNPQSGGSCPRSADRERRRHLQPWGRRVLR